LKKFRQNLRAALAELAAVGGHVAQVDDADTVRSLSVSVASEPSPLTPPQQASFSMPIVPVVSDAAKDTFRKRYPDFDLAACVAAWVAWPGSRKAHNPDATFWGFAKRWAASMAIKTPG